MKYYVAAKIIQKKMFVKVFSPILDKVSEFITKT